MNRIPCKYCGREIPPEANFCWYCNRQLISQPERPETGQKYKSAKQRALVWAFALVIGLAIILFFVIGSGG
ncbi:MAG: hypothetical protein HPY59_06820 [Anaerolineae bacterium]|nr:hypothetical protein [Anaerolineae bacterium]